MLRRALQFRDPLPWSAASAKTMLPRAAKDHFLRAPRNLGA
jgi:hypothetical protein